MHTQAQLEQHVASTLQSRGHAPNHETISDALDLALCKHEREQGQPINRDLICPTTAAATIDLAAEWIITTDQPDLQHRGH